jgi:O-antigen/teichoic acid export membrane protein
MYNYLLAFVAIFSFIFDFGIITNATVDIAQKKYNAFHAYGMMKFIVVFIGLILIYLSAIFYKDTRVDIGILFLAGISVGMVELGSYVFALYRAKGAFILESKWRFINGMLQLFFGGIAVIATKDLTSVFLVLILSQALMMLPLAQNLINIPFNRRSIGLSAFDLVKWRKCFPLALIALSGSLTSNIDTIFIAKYVSMDQIALYSLAVKIVYGILLMPAAYLQLATLGNISRLFSGDDTGISSRALWTKYFILSVWFGGVVTICSLYSLSYFIIYVFGEQYTNAIPYCLALTLSISLTYMTVPISQWLLLRNQRWVLVLIGAAGTLTMLVVLSLFAPTLKLWAGILAAVASNLVVLIISILRMRYLDASLINYRFAIHVCICITVIILVSSPIISQYLHEFF